jgi:excisionase family DNA binding protein
MDDQQLLTPDQVADRLQLSVYTILDYLRHGHPRGGKLRGFKSGKQWRIREADLQAFIEANLSNGDRPSVPHPVLVPLEDQEPPHSTQDAIHPVQRKAALVARLHELKAQGLSLQAIANRLNSEAVPTLSGRGTWKKGTVDNLLGEA